MTDRLHWSHPACATGVTVSRPPCAPDHPWASIPTADLARGLCPVCGGLLDGETAARMIRARDLLSGSPWRDDD